jgi:ABC-type sugar transport system permease subunit
VLTGNVVASGTVFQSTALADMLIQSGLDAGIVSFVTTIYNNIFDLLWQTGIQTIIFLAALQSISSSLYEASAIEGATAWENFWKITLPMISPHILVVMIYTIINSFVDTNTNIMAYIYDLTYDSFEFGLSAAMSWIYFIVIFAFVALTFLITRPFIFYQDK